MCLNTIEEQYDPPLENKQIVYRIMTDRGECHYGSYWFPTNLRLGLNQLHESCLSYYPELHLYNVGWHSFVDLNNSLYVFNKVRDYENYLVEKYKHDYHKFILNNTVLMKAEANGITTIGTKRIYDFVTDEYLKNHPFEDCSAKVVVSKSITLLEDITPKNS